MGTEQAAEIITWGVIERPLEIIGIFGNSCEELDAGYELLTGSPRRRSAAAEL